MCGLEVCSYQVPPNYTLNVVNEHGQLVDTTGPRSDCSVSQEFFTTGISGGGRYVVWLVIIQRHFTRQMQLNATVPEISKSTVTLKTHQHL